MSFYSLIAWSFHCPNKAHLTSQTGVTEMKSCTGSKKDPTVLYEKYKYPSNANANLSVYTRMS